MAALMIPLVVLVVAWSARASAALISAAAAIPCWEYYRMVFGKVPPEAWLGIVGAGAIPLVPVFAPPSHWGTILFAIVGGVSMSSWVLHLLEGRPGRA